MSTPQHTLIHVKTAPHIGAGEQVQAFASRLGVSSIPGACVKVERENQLYGLVL